MKKVSTRAAAQSRNISQQKLTIGLDLGDRNRWYCVLDESGQRRRRVQSRPPMPGYFCQYVMVRESVSNSFLSISSGVQTQTWR